jgi:N-sulfoglucosamine sulfohydrolase
MLVVVAATALQARGAPPRRPNILLVTADDLGEQLGCYGSKVVHTPHIDALARSSVRFTNAYVTQSSCSSSRSSLLTSLYPHQNGQIGLAHLGYAMPRTDLPTLPGELKKAGYHTGIIGKLHVAPESMFPFDYRRISAPESRDDELVTRRVGEFLDARADAPFFLYLNLFDPHGPYLRDVNGRPARKVGPEQVEPWPFIKKGKQPELSTIASFHTCINRMDELFGLVWAEMSRRGLADDLVVVFLGDNGPPFADAKTTCNVAGLKVPLLVRWPGVSKAGTTSDALASTLDLMPTLLAAAGLDVPKGLEGRPLNGPLRGSKEGWRTSIACEYTTHEPNDFNPLRSIRDGRHKLILGLIHDPKAGPPAELDQVPLARAFRRFALNEAVELYDLQLDPFEKTNLAAQPEHRETLDRLQAELLAWRKATHDPLLDPSVLAETTRREFERSKTYVPVPRGNEAREKAARTKARAAATKKAARP